VSSFQVVPAAYLLLLRGEADDTEVLLQLRGPGASYMSGHWAAGAAGHIEYGESVAVAAAREAREELGVEVRPGDIEPLCTMQRTEPGNPNPIEQRVDFFVTSRRWSGEPTIQEPGKCLELRWCRFGELPDPVVPHERHVLEQYAHGRVPPIISQGF
jgi:8-oxo-dGTP pyrophosphatase MutT (NUDIX family)